MAAGTLAGFVALGLGFLLAEVEGSSPGVAREPPRADRTVPFQEPAAPTSARPAPATAAAGPVISPMVKVALLERGDELPASTAWNDAAWQRIPLDKAQAESLGDLSTRQAFSAGMRNPPALASCTEGWIAPPGVRQVDMKLELRVRSEEDALVVEDVEVREANVSDGELERCVVSSLRGRRVAAPGVAPGHPYRLEWGARKYL